MALLRGFLTPLISGRAHLVCCVWNLGSGVSNVFIHFLSPRPQFETTGNHGSIRKKRSPNKNGPRIKKFGTQFQLFPPKMVLFKKFLHFQLASFVFFFMEIWTAHLSVTASSGGRWLLSSTNLEGKKRPQRVVLRCFFCHIIKGKWEMQLIQFILTKWYTSWNLLKRFVCLPLSIP